MGYCLDVSLYVALEKDTHERTHAHRETHTHADKRTKKKKKT